MSLSLSPGSKAGDLLVHFTKILVASQSKASVLATLALVAASAWIAGDLVWYSTDNNQTVTRWSAQQVVLSGKKDSKTDLTELLNAHLFGHYSSAAPTIVTAPPVNSDAPKTRLHLVLVGVVSSSSPERGLAVIANKGTQSTYGIGEKIEGTRAKLKAVFVDRVIIDNSGRDETLMLEGLEYNSLADNSSDNSTASSRPVMQKGNNSQDKLEKIKQELAKNPKKLLQYIRLSQVRAGDGQLSGYRVKPGRDKILFNSVGLKSGDIATHINGESLTDPKTMGTLLKTLGELAEINLTVERDGQVEEIYIQL